MRTTPKISANAFLIDFVFGGSAQSHYIVVFCITSLWRFYCWPSLTSAAHLQTYQRANWPNWPNWPVCVCILSSVGALDDNVRSCAIHTLHQKTDSNVVVVDDGPSHGTERVYLGECVDCRLLNLLVLLCSVFCVSVSADKRQREMDENESFV